MNQHEVDLTLALYYEHKDHSGTGHDCMDTSLSNRIRIVKCDTCLYLGKLMKAAQEQEVEGILHPPEDGSAT